MSGVMVVDDEPDVRMLARVLLEQAGHDVVEAGSGEEALELIGDARVEIMMLDLRMGGISGWEVLSELRERGQLDGVRIIVFSAQIEPEAYTRAMSMGAAGFLSKPFTPDELLDAIARTGA